MARFRRASAAMYLWTESGRSDPGATLRPRGRGGRNSALRRWFLAKGVAAGVARRLDSYEPDSDGQMIPTTRRLAALGLVLVGGAAAVARALRPARGRERHRRQRDLHPHRRPVPRSELAAMPNDAGADRRRRGRPSTPRLRLLSRSAALRGRPADRPVHAQPRRARQPPALRRLDAVRRRTRRMPCRSGLHDAGYYNVHIGKYMNGYATGVTAPPFPVPPGWDEWYGKVSEGPLYFNYQLIEKTAPGDDARTGLLRRPDERLPDRRLLAQGGGLHRHRRRPQAPF